MKKNESRTSGILRSKSDSFLPRKDPTALSAAESEVHIYGKGHICLTDNKGYSTPNNRNPDELVIDASEGFIPLWSKNVNLRWRFNPNSMNYFQFPEDAKNEIRKLFSNAILAWGDSAPVTFSERDEAWDFEIVITPDNCSPRGCVLASAFFPDSGRHELKLYPKLFSQSEEEQLETLEHEIGHIFGLRHFFANVSETAYPSIIFGTHKPFTIMNYGEESKLTDEDRYDLKALYQKVWSGELTKINGTRIVTFNSFHQLGGI